MLAFSIRDLESCLAAYSYLRSFFIFSGVDFLGDRLRDLERREFLWTGEIETVGFKMDFTDGIAADYIRTSVKTSVTRAAKSVEQPVADFRRLP